MEELWLVGKVLAQHSEGLVWEFAGLFASEDIAIGACPDNAYFIAPVVVGVRIPKASTPWPGCYYPRERHGHSDSASG